MLNLFITLLSFTPNSWSQTVLTEQRSNVTLSIPMRGSQSPDDYKARAQSILSFVESKVFSKVPSSLLSKVSTKTLRIEFTSKIKEGEFFGGFFNPDLSQKGELLIQVRENLFNDESMLRMIAHEWFHALHFTLHPEEPRWVREGLAQVFEYIVFSSYNGPNLLAGLDESTSSLEFQTRTDREAYGHAFLYFYFLYKKCGGEVLFWKLAESAPQQFGADTVNNALKGNDKKECADFETSVLHAELARFHNRKIQGKDTQSDLYWIIPEFDRSPKIIRTGMLDQSVIDALPVYQPLLLDQKYKTALKPFLKNPKLWIYTLSKTYPYLVQPGINLSNSMNDETLFVLKRK